LTGHIVITVYHLQVLAFKNVLKVTGANLQLNMSDAPHQPLPPASLQTFLKEHPNISGLMIANHEKEFINRYLLYIALLAHWKLSVLIVTLNKMHQP